MTTVDGLILLYTVWILWFVHKNTGKLAHIIVRVKAMINGWPSSMDFRGIRGHTLLNILEVSSL